MIICIGMTVFNGGRHLQLALNSLLDQTHKDFILIVLDDNSSDDSWSIICEYKKIDSRIKAIKNNKRSGAISAWRKVYDCALKEKSEYFAWASDHDLWDRTWLEVLYKNLNQDKNRALAYSHTTRIDDNGCEIVYKSPDFNTNELTIEQRIKKLRSHGNGYGDMIYGLFRINALNSTGIYRRLLLPDTVTIWEISLYGTISQVSEKLWFRRYVDLYSIKRQRRMLFLLPPYYTYIPYWLVNPLVIFWQGLIGVRKSTMTKVNLFYYIKLGASYGFAFSRIELKRAAKTCLKKCQFIY